MVFVLNDIGCILTKKMSGKWSSSKNINRHNDNTSKITKKTTSL